MDGFAPAARRSVDRRQRHGSFGHARKVFGYGTSMGPITYTISHSHASPVCGLTTPQLDSAGNCVFVCCYNVHLGGIPDLLRIRAEEWPMQAPFHPPVSSRDEPRGNSAQDWHWGKYQARLAKGCESPSCYLGGYGLGELTHGGVRGC